jgi:hypothetical protein
MFRENPNWQPSFLPTSARTDVAFVEVKYVGAEKCDQAVTISRRLGSFNFAFVAHNPAEGVLM